MKSDYRLNYACVHTDKYREQQKQELENARQIILQNSNVGVICDWLVCELLYRLDNVRFQQCLEPDIPAFTSDIQEALSELHQGIIEQEGAVNFSNPMVIAISEVIAGKLADKIKEQNFSIWTAISERIQEQHELYSSWIRYIPVTTIKKHLPEIVKGPEAEHPLALVETWGRYRDETKWPDFDDYLKEQEDQAIDRWDYVSKVIAMTEEWWPGIALRFHSDLLQRAGWDCWLQWLLGLDIPLQHLMLREIEDLDVYEQLIERCCSYTGLGTQARRFDLLILMIMGYLQLCKEISSNLRRWIEVRMVTNEEEETYRQNVESELNNWVNCEMYERALRIIKVIDLSSTLGKELACLMLSNLQAKDAIRDLPDNLLRQAVVEELRSKPDSAKFVIEQLILSPVCGKQKLVSVWGILNNQKEDSLIVNYRFTLWKYFIDWLQSASFNWYSTNITGTDDDVLIQTMAGLLAKMEDPVVCWREAYHEVYYPPEGWGWQFEKYNESLDRIDHLLIVGFVAADGLLSHHDQGIGMFQLVWDKMIHSIRTSHGYLFRPGLQVPISFGWGRLPYVLPETYPELALRSLEKIDDIELLIFCTTQLWSSAEGYPDLARLFAPLNDYVKMRFNKDFPMLQAKYGEGDPRIKDYVTILEGLGYI